MKKKYILFVASALVIGLTSFSNAYALDLNEAKSKGLVGENQNGYIEAVGGGASVEVKSLIGEINRKRRQKYEEISKKNGQPINVVEDLAGKKVISNAKPGHYYKDDSSNWVQK